MHSICHLHAGARRYKWQWAISWDEHRRVQRPMTVERWRAWLEEHVGTLDSERLETLEG